MALTYQKQSLASGIVFAFVRTINSIRHDKKLFFAFCPQYETAKIIFNH